MGHNRAIGTVLFFLTTAVLLPQPTSAQTPYDTFRDRLVELYGEERAQEIEYAEAFELGHSPKCTSRLNASLRAVARSTTEWAEKGTMIFGRGA